MTVYTLFGQPASPGGTSDADTSHYTFGMEFYLSQSASLTGVWFFSDPLSAVLPSDCCIYDVLSQTIVSGSSKTSVTWSGAPGGGWVKCSYNGSVTLNASQRYKVCVNIPGGARCYSASSHYWDGAGAGAAGLTSGIITAPNNASGDGGQDTFNTSGSSGSFAYPSGSFNATNYWLDIEVTVSSPSNSGLLVSCFP